LKSNRNTLRENFISQFEHRLQDPSNNTLKMVSLQEVYEMFQKMELTLENPPPQMGHFNNWDSFGRMNSASTNPNNSRHASYDARRGGQPSYQVRNDRFSSFGMGYPDQSSHRMAKASTYTPGEHSRKKKNAKKTQTRMHSSNYRARQDLVQRTRAEVKELLGNRLIDDDSNTYLRGPSVLFIPSKSPGSLEHIAEFVKKIDEDPRCTIKKAALPLSRKNEFQLKGFLAYLQMGSEQEVEYVKKNIYEQDYKEHFQKCVAAQFKKSFREKGEPSQGKERSTGVDSKEATKVRTQEVEQKI